MSGTVHKELRPLVRKAEKAGWTLQHRMSNHLALLAPDGETVINFAGSPGTVYRVHRSLRAQLRRHGVDV